MWTVLLESRNVPSGWSSGRLSAGSAGTGVHTIPSSEVDGVAVGRGVLELDVEHAAEDVDAARRRGGVSR